MNFKSLKFTVVLSVLFFGQLNSAAQELNSDKHLLAVMRTIGHQILLDAGDSTSRVLPVSKNENEFKLEFSSDFSFDPGKVSAAADSIIRFNNVAFNYILEVIRCEDEEVVYNYEVSVSPESSLIPCGGRLVMSACYYVIITLLDNQYLEDSLNFTAANFEEEKSNSVLYFSIAIFVGSGILLLIYLKKRKKNTVLNSDLIEIGNYVFDKRNLELSLNGNKTDLSSKEGDLLTLLHASANNTLKRETILKVVWEDEGAYVGRTLDVFISKLRKKLEQDERIKIMNVRGVGYKLVVG
jgi:DNA-binding winged helix-turn-helix (wHTH) protein